MISLINDANDRLGLMLFLAALLHLMVILGVSFEFKDRSAKKQQQSLDIIIVQQPKPEPTKEPEKADYLAQATQSGAGGQEEKTKPKTVAPELTPLAPPTPPQNRLTEQSETLTVQEAEVKTPDSRKPEPVSESPPILTSAQLFASKQREIALLTAELDRKTQAYAKMPKRKAISARTKEYKYAAYLDAWRRKVERIGNLNYPDEARRQKLYGSLILHVAVKEDGQIEQVRVLQSSGHKLLDDAALRIVRLAAPYSPFPKEIREEVNILDITRTWRFSRDQLDTR
jgi:protein TonB